MKNKVVLFVLFMCCFGLAQTHQATLENNQVDGLHQVLIPSEVRSAMKNNLNYFRILDKNKNEVPYVVFSNTSRNTSLYEKLVVEKKAVLKDSLSTYTVKNYDVENNGELILLVSNTEVTKRYSISGSNDEKEWFGLVSDQLLTNLNNETGTFVEKTLQFPSNSYRFLKISLNDKKSLPINILEIGFYKGENKAAESIELSLFQYKIVEDKKNKKTNIIFTSEANHKVDAIAFSIATKLYSRNAKVIVNKTREIKRKTEKYQEEIARFLLNSNTSNHFQLNGFFGKEFTIEIENQDNQPLEFSKIGIFQNALYVITEVKANEKYEIIIDTTLVQPKYDLANFVQSFSVGIPKASISNLTTISSIKTTASDQSFWQSKAFMWMCIVFGIAIVGYFAIGLLKDMKR